MQADLGQIERDNRLNAKRSLSPQKGEATSTTAHSLGTDGDELRAEGVQIGTGRKSRERAAMY
jgi:hypothetical protein